jgi:hypothetical protein
MKKLVVLGSVTLSLLLAYGCSGGTSDVGPGTGGDGGGTGTEGGSTTTTDSGTSSTADSGKATDSGSSADTGPADSGSVLTGAALKFHGCPAFAPCGGVVAGNWEFTGGCIEDPLAAFKAQCASLVEKSLAGSIKGTVMFTPASATTGTLTRSATVGFVADVEFAASCSGGFGCAAVPLGIGSFVPGATATCSGTTTCACKITVTNGDSLSSGYTLAGNTVNVSNGEAYDYCITGTNLKYRQTKGPDGGKPALDGTFDLVKK